MLVRLPVRLGTSPRTLPLNKPFWPTCLYKRSSSQALFQSGCHLGWGSSAPTSNVNKIQYKPKVQKCKKKTNKRFQKKKKKNTLVELISTSNREKKTNAALTEVRKILPEKKNLCGEKCAGNLGRNQGSSFKRLEAHPTKALLFPSHSPRFRLCLPKICKKKKKKKKKK